MRNAISCPLAFAGFALVLTGAAPASEYIVPLRGTIQRTQGDIYVVKSSDGRQRQLRLAANAAIAVRLNTAPWPISEGSYLGIAGIPQPDGRLRAVEVGIFNETLRGAAQGHHRLGDSRSQATMSYGTAWQVTRTAGDALAVLYDMHGQKRIVIPSGTPVAAYLSGSVADLKPGATIYVPATIRRPHDLLEAAYVMLERRDTPPE
jgi:hypothetical protein